MSETTKMDVVNQAIFEVILPVMQLFFAISQYLLSVKQIKANKCSQITVFFLNIF